GPRVIETFHRHLRFPRPRRGFASRTGLVNRERELRAVRAALVDAPHTRILYLCGPGGVGKTRLLEESRRLVRETEAPSTLCWSGILDLYHIDLHSVSALQNALIQGLDPGEQYFQRYRSARARFESLRTAGTVDHVLDLHREELEDLFFADYN